MKYFDILSRKTVPVVKKTEIPGPRVKYLPGKTNNCVSKWNLANIVYFQFVGQVFWELQEKLFRHYV